MGRDIFFFCSTVRPVSSCLIPKHLYLGIRLLVLDKKIAWCLPHTVSSDAPLRPYFYFFLHAYQSSMCVQSCH